MRGTEAGEEAPGGCRIPHAAYGRESIQAEVIASWDDIRGHGEPDVSREATRGAAKEGA